MFEFRRMYFAVGSQCYFYSHQTQVKNCGGFYIYNLVPIRYDGLCIRYCGYHNPSLPGIESSSALISAIPTSITRSTVTPLFSASPSTSSIQPTTPVSQNTDGCSAYQILSDNTRAVTYANLSYQRCDANLYGWYRFKGDAGNRMLDYCPLSVSGSRYNRCGTGMQGWITSGSMPSQYEGEVSRMVCFSDSSSCRCQYQKQIKVRNCGTFYVYWLDGVSACNQRYCGVKGEVSLALFF